MKSIREIRKKIDAAMLLGGFDKQGDGWSLSGGDFTVKIELQRSRFDGQCWINIKVIEKDNPFLVAGIDLRLEDKFPELRQNILEGLNIDGNQSAIDRFSQMECGDLMKEVSGLTALSSIRRDYAAGLLDGAAITIAFRNKYLTDS